MPDVLGKAFVQPTRFFRSQSRFHSNSRRPQLDESLSLDQGIWVLHGRDHPLDACRDQCLRAGAGTTLVRAGFQVDVQGCAPRPFSRLLQGKNLGMF